MKATITFVLLWSVHCLAAVTPDNSGTYDVVVCKSECSFEDPSTAVARGVVVLFDLPLPDAAVKRIDQFHFGGPDEIIRACYVGKRGPSASTFAFGGGSGVTSWAMNGDSLSFDLFRSVDAGYSVDAEFRNNEFRGKGISWGAGVASPGFTPDIVIGRRRGPAKLDVCMRSGQVGS